ncbi:hypothetical protein AC249_AIPGENE23491 [Exaiptasia diaphana]|nr:hypothetical protein AC249_AIPGENE23491 [Exaiptasia diaphana]
MNNELKVVRAVNMLEKTQYQIRKESYVDSQWQQVGMIGKKIKLLCKAQGFTNGRSQTEINDTLLSDDEIFGQSEAEDEAESDDTDDAEMMTEKVDKKTKKGKKAAKRLKKGKKAKSLTKKANQLMYLGLKAAKLHMKYLNKSAQAQGMYLSSSSELS